MINLLPPEYRRDLQAAQANTLLLRYNIALACVVGFMVLAFGLTYFYLNISNNTSEATIADNEQKAASYQKTRQEANDFRNNLAIAKTILSRQVNYSTLITDIAHALPSGVVLQSITLDSSTFGKPTTITAYAKSSKDALELKDSFTKHTELFSDVSLESINSQSDTPGYPVIVTLNITIKPGAAS